MSTEFWDTHM